MSQRWSDWTFLCEMVNGDLRSGQWAHYCWDNNGACCNIKDEALEKTTMACVNAMFGQADPIPAESRWMHLLSNMRKTLLRAIVHRVGLDCFGCADMDADEGNIDVDADAVGGFAEKARAARSRRTKEYYNDDKNTFQLCIFACLIKVLGDGDDDDGYKSLGEG